VRRKSNRADYSVDRVQEVLDEALSCHVGVVRGEWPIVLCMAHGRDGGTLYLHGSAAAGMFRDMRRGRKVCVTATLLDGLVLGRSARNHSMNYRSAVILGEAHSVDAREEKLRGLRIVTEHTLKGRWGQLRHPTDAELAETGLWRLSLRDASCKIRTGPPIDPPADAALPVWAGVLPLTTSIGSPIPAPDLPPRVVPGPDVRSLLSS
jgi:hypothetical protein